MRFAVIVALVASVSAITIRSNPTASAKAREETLETSRKVVAAQQKFEADHFAMHTKNMETAETECQTLKTKVRAARAAMVAGGDQSPPMKTY